MILAQATRPCLILPILIDILKIDRSFISKIGKNKQEAIVSAMIAMGKAMGMMNSLQKVLKPSNSYSTCKIWNAILLKVSFFKPLPEKEATTYLEQHRLIPS